MGDHALTQQQLARETGVSQSSISQYLAGNRLPSREAALAFARRFAVRAEAFLTLSPGTLDDEAE